MMKTSPAVWVALTLGACSLACGGAQHAQTVGPDDALARDADGPARAAAQSAPAPAVAQGASQPVAPAPPAPTSAAPDQLAVNSDTANFGVHALHAGFVPDPKVINVRSGGDINTRSIGLPGGCNGYVTRQPDAVLNYSGTPGTHLLRLYVLAAGDTTLVINDGAGNWHCNDDSNGGRNPQVDIANPPAGHYDVWVGSYQSGEQHVGTLRITELTSNSTAGGGGGSAYSPGPPPPPPDPGNGVIMLEAGTE